MKRASIAETFRTRLAGLVADHPGGRTGFARDVGIDRSALVAFLAPSATRLPRAETLRAIAEARGTSIDWLLGLANAAEGGQEVALSLEVETPPDPETEPPLARWQTEAEGGKIRYVPASLPDLLRLPEFSFEAVEAGRAEARSAHAQGLREGALLRDTDVEICMSRQMLETLADGTGLWAGLAPRLRRAQLAHMAGECEKLYPSVRLHLFDARRTFSAPFTVFAMKRAAVYLGRSYLVVTAAEQVRGLARHFDTLIRHSVVAPDTVHRTLSALAARTG